MAMSLSYGATGFIMGTTIATAPVSLADEFDQGGDPGSLPRTWTPSLRRARARTGAPRPVMAKLGLGQPP